MEDKILYRNIKYPRIELKTGKLILVLPFGYNSKSILLKHKKWIDNKIKFIKECRKEAKNKKLIKRTDEVFKNLIKNYIAKLSKKLNVNVKNIYFRRMKTKWASLSSKKNLTINLLAKYLPEYLIEYIVYHELVHVIEKKHNKRFWELIRKQYKKYEEFEKELFVYWFLVSKKL